MTQRVQTSTQQHTNKYRTTVFYNISMKETRSVSLSARFAWT